MRFLVGGYSPDMGGTAGGIGILTAGAPDDAHARGALSYAGVAATALSPSWIARHPTAGVIYAALEGAGQVQAFRESGPDRYLPYGEPVVVGESPCHIHISADARSIWVACWSDGRLVRVALDATGVLRESTDLAAATDPWAAGESDRVPHAHQSIAIGRDVIASTDMGYDLVRFWDPGAASGAAPRQEVVLPRGSGPRHMLWHPSGHLYVLAELSCEVFVLAPDPSGAWRLVGGTPVGAGTLPGDTAAEIAMTADGEVLIAGVRGSNTLAALRVRGQGETAQPVALVESGVDWPRHHVVVGDAVLVAGQRSNDVVSLELDERTGVPRGVRRRAEVPAPTCLRQVP